jgi:hypothetical protein
MNKAQCAFGPAGRKMENGQFNNQQREEIDEAKTNDEASYEIVLAKC